MHPAIFFDRDGVINIDTHYLHKPEDFEFTPGVLAALKQLSPHFKLFIITNQSGIGRGYFSNDDYLNLTSWMEKALKKEGIVFEEIAYCPHTPSDNCDCRKPSPKLILDIASKHTVDLSRSWMIGDKLSDLQCGHNANIPNLIFYNNGLNPITENIPFPYSSTDSMTTLTSIILSKATQ